LSATLIPLVFSLQQPPSLTIHQLAGIARSGNAYFLT